MQRRRVRSLLFYAGSLVLGGVLLYLALRPVPFGALVDALREANYWYLVPLALVGTLSHVLRAWRWLLLLDELPSGSGTRRATLWPSFASVMIGYMVNYVAPRLGELARAGNMSAQTRQSFTAVFGSVVIERVLDVVTLGVAFAIAAVVAAQHLPGLREVVTDAMGPLELSLGLGLLLGGLVAAGVAVILLMLRWARRSANATPTGRIARIVQAFVDGLASLIRTRRRAALALSTVGIWLCYLVITYLPFLMLGIDGLTWADALLLLAVGSLGMMVPAPGGIGSYHYITILVMTQLLVVAAPLATAYAVLMHAAQLVLYVSIGLVCLLLQGRGLVLEAATVPSS